MLPLYISLVRYVILPEECSAAVAGDPAIVKVLCSDVDDEIIAEPGSLKAGVAVALAKRRARIHEQWCWALSRAVWETSVLDDRRCPQVPRPRAPHREPSL